jgi:hypothetical protein
VAGGRDADNARLVLRGAVDDERAHQETGQGEVGNIVDSQVALDVIFFLIGREISRGC